MHKTIAQLLDRYEAGQINRRQLAGKLAEKGLSPRRPSGTNRIYFRDPDGLVVQLSATDDRP